VKSISKERVGALSDGVVAIAATILVLELKVPEDHSVSRSDVEHWALLFLGWVVSFIMIAIMWLENHRQLVLASVWTMPLMVVTFAQLGLISLIPFGSNLIMDQPDNLASAITFNSIMFTNGVCAGLGGLVLARDLRIHADPTLAVKLVRRSLAQILIYAVIALIGLLGAILHHPFLGVVLWLSMPLVAWFWLGSADKATATPTSPYSKAKFLMKTKAKSSGGGSFRSRAIRLLRNPRFEMGLGIAVFLIGLSELIEETFVILFPSPEVHHALLLFGAVTAVRGLVDVVEGMEQVAEGELHSTHSKKDGLPETEGEI